MTGRERVTAVLEGRTADRLPIDIGATEMTGICAEAYAPLKTALGVAGGHTRVADPCLFTVRVERTFRDRLGCDAAGLFFEPRKWRPGRLPDGSECLYPERWHTSPTPDGGEVFRHPVAELTYVRRPGERIFRCGDPPLADCHTPADVAKKLQALAFFDWPYQADETAPEFGARSRAKRKETDAALIANCRTRLIGGALCLRGEAFLRDLEENPPLADTILGRLADAYVARLTDILPEVLGTADAICICEGPAGGLSVEAYRKHIRRHHERIFAHIKKTSALPLIVALHDVEPVLARELIELGADAVAFAAGRHPPDRSVLGPDVVLWGPGLGTDILTKGTPASAQEAFKRRVEACGGPARLIFAFGEPLPPGTQAENLLAVLETAKELRP